MSFAILDPTGQGEDQQRSLARRSASLRGATVGLLNSTKRNSDLLLAALGAELVERYGVKELVERSKPTFSVPAPDPLIEEMAARCHIIITGVGD
ncbi:MAG: hypothetical protein KGJ86_02345 [Chloroflexota bacterium]|nr:hypothetical protein [Chloroflexota bacterium]